MRSDPELRIAGKQADELAEERTDRWVAEMGSSPTVDPAPRTTAVEELSDVVTRQAAEVRALSRRVGLLMEREAEREVADGTSIPLADQKPPHW